VSVYQQVGYVIAGIVFVCGSFWTVLQVAENRFELKKDADSHKEWSEETNKLWEDRYRTTGNQLLHDIKLIKAEMDIRLYEDLIANRNEAKLHRLLSEAEELKRHLMKEE
jgi:hypothetical protein